MYVIYVCSISFYIHLESEINLNSMSSSKYVLHVMLINVHCFLGAVHSIGIHNRNIN